MNNFKKVKLRKIYCIKCKKYKELNSWKYHIIVIKYYFFLVFLRSVEVKMNNHLWRENQLSIKILKLLVLLNNIEEYQKIYSHV